MHFLPMPTVNDMMVTRCLARNSNLTTSYPYLQQELSTILRRYRLYDAINANPLNIPLPWLPISEELKKGLISNYISPPKELSFIKEAREQAGTCPMCGSFFTTNLDHYFPKEDFPEWSVFSKNLIPACHCNIRRKRILTGKHSHRERVLHPYYDNFLAQRLIGCSISPKHRFRVINVELINLMDQANCNYHAVSFHIKNVVFRSGIIKYIKQCWETIYIQPANFILDLDESTHIPDVNDFRLRLEGYMRKLDRKFASQNNWESVLMYGILNNNETLEWVHQHHNQAVINGPFL